LEVDAINRSSPTVDELEDGLSRLIVGEYIERQNELFTATGMSFNLWNDITKPGIVKRNIFEQLDILTDRLNRSPLEKVSQQLTITPGELRDANREAREIFEEADREAKNILAARGYSIKMGQSIDSRKPRPKWVSLLMIGGISLCIGAALIAAFWLLLRS
jgi:hypothetical protein